MRNLSACCLAALVLAGCGGDNAPSSAGACSVDGECPLHQLCAPPGLCVSGCLSSVDCPGASCGEHGRCQPSPGPDGLGTALDGSAGGDQSSSSDGDLSGAFDLAYADAWICTGVCPDASLEPNNASTDATAANAYSTMSSLAICPRGDVDFFKVIAPAKGTLTATLTNGPCGPALDVDVLAADGATVLGASQATASGATASSTVDATDVRYVRVRAHTNGDQNFYVLALNVQ
jgi:hypothetical protein